MSKFFFGKMEAHRVKDGCWNLSIRDEDGNESVINLTPGDPPSMEIHWNDETKTWEYRPLAVK